MLCHTIATSTQFLQETNQSSLPDILGIAGYVSSSIQLNLGSRAYYHHDPVAYSS